MKNDNIDKATKTANFRVKQQQDYKFKIQYATVRAKEFARECDKRDLNYHVSVGGLDSITLFLFLKSIGIDAPGISVSSLEDPSIQKVHEQLGIECIKPAVRYIDADGTVHRWNKASIIQEFGFPVLSKEIAEHIEILANPTPKNKTSRDKYVTGGKYGDNRWAKLPKKWLEKFGGYVNDEYGTDYMTPNFKVSDKCCYYLKEKPCADWAREHNSVPYLGLMASEGGRREAYLIWNGCNYFGKTSIRSAPFAIFSRQDLLQLAIDLDVPVPEIYGTIERREDGTLYTTKAQRTGCSMCGFGIHMEKRPNRFDRLKEKNPKEWEYWMYNCCTDTETGEKYGWARVLDYIGVEYEK